MQRWLQSVLQTAGATRALVIASEGKRPVPLATVPASVPPGRDIFAAANAALHKQHIAWRPGQSSTTNAQARLLIGQLVEVGGAPAAVALEFENADVSNDAAFADAIVRIILAQPIADPAPPVAISAAPAAAAAAAPAPVAAPVAEPDPTPPQQDPEPERSRKEAPALDAARTDRVLSLETVARTGLFPVARTTGSPAPDARPMAPTELVEAQGAAIASLAAVLDREHVAESLHALADGIAQHWTCQRVAVATYRGRKLAVDAMSGAVDFESKSALIVDIGRALEETCAARAMISIPDEESEAPPRNHLTLANQLKKPSLLSVPLIYGEDVVGAIMLERDFAFSEPEREQISQMALLLAPVIGLKKLDALSPAEWVARFARRYASKLLGPEHLLPKAVVALLAILAGWSMLHHETFRVDADARLEPSVNRAVVSAFDTYLSQVERRAGDIVARGDVLARLDAEELGLERVRWVGERDKLAKEYRATLAQRDRSNVRVLEARRDQAQAQIDLIDAQMARAVLRAPIDGVVVSGDLSQQLGSPVERGQLLFEVASLDDYRLVLMVDETDVSWVAEGSTGQLRLRSLPDRPFNFAVTAITPVSEPGEGANRFRVEASFDELPENMRPGMEGVAKIDVGSRSIAWIWTRSFIHWAQLQLWKLGL